MRVSPTNQKGNNKTDFVDSCCLDGNFDGHWL